MNTLLVIEDDAAVRSDILDLLDAEGFRGIAAEDSQRGVELALRERPDLVICELSGSGIDGYEVYERLSVQPATAATPFIFLSAEAEAAHARRGLAVGTDDFLTRPFARAELLDSIRTHLRRSRDEASVARDRSSELQVKAAEPPEPPALVVQDPRMKELVAQLERVARGPISVLILGESGVGKELLAAHVHHVSGRGGPFVALSCAGLSEQRLASELETADGGTLFLDDVGELPPATQGQLSRVLEERKVLRGGGRTARSIDLRLISATRCDLDRAIEAGQFRADLYYRLNGFSLIIPPLRERPADLPALARHFVNRAAEVRQIDPPQLSEAVMTVLASQRWPGNLRELSNVLERAVLLCEGSELFPVHLPAKLVHEAAAPASDAHPIDPRAGFGREVEKLDRRRILDALAQCGGNQTQAADLLGVSRRTLVTRLGQYRLPRPRLSSKRSRPG